MEIMEKFLNGKLMVGKREDTEQDRREFLELLDSKGIKWNSGHRPLEWEYALGRKYYVICNYGTLANVYCNGDISCKDFLKQYKEEQNMFTKNDLKSGMLIETRDGCKGIICNKIKGCDFIAFQSGSMYLSFNNDLTSKNGYKDNDIVKVYDLPCCEISIDEMLDISFRHLLWERKKEVKEVTIEELEKIYGCKVKIVKG